MRRDPAIDAEIDPLTMSEEEWRALLHPAEFAILRHAATERSFTGRYLDDPPGPGAYHCAGCGQRLYGAQHKFHSGCGWPSFFDEIEPGALSVHRDLSFGMVRTEMRCSRCGGHMGHIFEDAPHMPTGTRHCVNGASILFVPEGEDKAAIFAAHRPA